MQILPHSLAMGQSGSEQRLVDRAPFDQIILKESGESEPLEVLPLELPQRPLDSVPTTGNLTVKLIERPTEEFQVSWSDIAQVRVFEQLLLDEARRLTAAEAFDEAFDYFARLSSDYPELAGLDEAIAEYLRRNALALYQAKKHDQALAVLLTLYERNPKSPGLSGAVERVAGEIIEQYLRAGDYAAARSVLVLWQTRFRGLASTAAAEWQRRFEAAASKQASEALRLIQDKRYVDARKAVGKAVAIWPQLDAATPIVAQIQRQYPFVTVGVLETAPRQPNWRIDCWPAIRASGLTQQLLAEQIGFGVEGGIYRSPFGELAVDESGRLLEFELHNSHLSSDALARFLLSMAQPNSAYYRPDLTSLLAGVAVPSPTTVQIHLSRLHVRPEAMLRVPPPTSAAAAAYAVADVTPNQVVFAAARAQSARPSGQLHAVVEQTVSDDVAADLIISGQIDVLDRVPPWHLERLRSVQGVRVESYRLPTVHVLIPNLQHPLLAKREFRRALCFGIDRRWIVERVILGGASAAGFEVLSGPFPTGTSLSDPLRYAYNNQVMPRPFEPRLAAILATVAWSAVGVASAGANDANSKEPVAADIPPLTLAHPAEPVARLACQSIQTQLERQGIRIVLQEFTAEQLAQGKVECDIRYAELAVWEPVVDARLLLGPGSLTEQLNSPYLNSTLRRLDEATNWNDVRARLAEVHEIAHHELPLIPLWQTVNYYAYRTALHGIEQSPVTLYQDIDQWSVAPSGNVARIQQDVP